MNRLITLDDKIMKDKKVSKSDNKMQTKQQTIYNKNYYNKRLCYNINIAIKYPNKFNSFIQKFAYKTTLLLNMHG